MGARDLRHSGPPTDSDGPYRIRVDEIDPKREVIWHCHHGQRSAAVVEWLRRRGIPAVNLSGGIDAWAVEVDPALSRY